MMPRLSSGLEQSSSSPTKTTTSFDFWCGHSLESTSAGWEAPPTPVAFWMARRAASSACSWPEPQVPTFTFWPNCVTSAWSWSSSGPPADTGPQPVAGGAGAGQKSGLSKCSTRGLAPARTKSPRG
jgi:hypothetical protein